MKRRTFLQTTMAAAALTPFASSPLLAGGYRPSPATPADLDAIRGDGRQVTIKGGAVKDLAASLHGRLLLADSAGYEIARLVLNPGIDKHPALIAQPTGVTDVRRAVAFAQAHGLLVAVKCGGHSFSGMSTCDKGMMIDLSAMRGAHVDPAARRVWVQGGTLLGLVDHETAPHGLVTTMGTVSHTGVGGLTTGGGFGRLARKFGLALDNVTAVDVVTADGRLHHASSQENPDLFWGVRGAGGNFGVVTGFEFQLHQMAPQVVAGALVFPIARARDILRFYADYAPQAPDDLELGFAMVQPPGKAPGVMVLTACYCGPAADAERALAPLRKLGTPIDDTIKTADYVQVQKSGDISDPRAMANYVKSGFTTGLPNTLITAMLEGFEPHPERRTQIFAQQSGGAINRIASDATAFPHRHAAHNLLTAVAWKAGTDGAPHMAAVRKYWAALEPLTSGFYTNEVDDESGATINANYRGNYSRLVAIKKQHDPGNLFRLNANVNPMT